MTMILERWETNEVSPIPMIGPAFYLETVSKAMDTRRENPDLV